MLTGSREKVTHSMDEVLILLDWTVVSEMVFPWMRETALLARK